MTKDLINQLKETLGDLANLTPEKMRELIQTTLMAFRELQSQLLSKDPAEKEAALQAANHLKEVFEIEAEKIYSNLGMDPQTVAAFAMNPENFSQKEWETVSQFSREIELIKNDGSNDKNPRKKPKKNRILRLVG